MRQSGEEDPEERADGGGEESARPRGGRAGQMMAALTGLNAASCERNGCFHAVLYGSPHWSQCCQL